MFRPPRRHYQRSSRGGFGVLLLIGQILQIGTNHIPPVTLAVVALNAVIYLQILRAFLPFVPTVSGACTSNDLVFSSHQYHRLLTSSFYHLDDMHLYFNMVSFIWKGMSLERRYGARKFLIMILLFAVGSQICMLGLNKMLAVVFLNKSYLRTCAAGFSAVCFALKVVTTYYMEENELVLGMFPIPARYACWAELVAIQILVPNASFTGHLAGILVGLAFIKGPLKILMNTIDGFFHGLTNPRPSTYSAGRTIGGQGVPASRRSDSDDEDLQEAIRESLRHHSMHEQQQQQTRPPSYGWNLGGGHAADPPYPSSGDGPPYPQHNRGSHRRSEPSAPPSFDYDDGDTYSYGRPPYPVDPDDLPRDPPPYSSLPPESHDQYSNVHLPRSYSEDRTSAEQARQARLRRFDKK